jgi:hypothetical protein
MIFAADRSNDLNNLAGAVARFRFCMWYFV